jgi:hypothetical protein
MNRRRLNRPSLKITHRVDRRYVSQFVFEVWNPFVSEYQPIDSVEDGLRRVGELADLICRMWLQRHPKQDVLADVPDPVTTDGARWAEFRINATTFKSYDTRRDDRLAWARAAGLTQAAVTICARVGYAAPASNAM